MLNALRIYGSITLVALLVWLYAERESLTSRAIETRIALVVGEARADELTIRLPGTTGAPSTALSVRVVIRGSQAAVDNARRAAESVLTLGPEELGLIIDDGGFVDGLVTVDLERAIGSLDIFRTGGVEVVEVTPRTRQIESIAFQVYPEVPVRVQLPQGVAVEGTPEALNTPTTRIKVPRRLLDPSPNTPTQFSVIASLDESQLATLQPGEPATVRTQDLTIQGLSPDAASNPLASLMRVLGQPATGIDVRLTLRSTLTTATLPSVPIWLATPPSELSRWSITLPQSDSVVQVKLRGPRDLLDRIASGALPLVGIVALEPTALIQGIQTVDIAWVVLEAGLPSPLPVGVVVEPGIQSVSLEIQPAPAPTD